MSKIKLSNSAIAALDLLHAEQPLNAKAIKDGLPFSQRTIQYALHQLLTHSLVERGNTLHDLRESVYRLSAKASLYGYNPRSM